MSTPTPVKLGKSEVLKAFDAACVGSRIVEPEAFVALLTTSVAEHDFAKGASILLPAEACAMVLSGDGRKVPQPECYAVRTWRGQPQMCLLRSAVPATSPKSVTAIVYTRDMYLDDPQVKASPELAEFQASDYTHIIVAVLATVFDGPPAMAPERLVINIAGGNSKYVSDGKDQAALAAMALAAIEDAKLVERGMNEGRVTMCD